MINELAININEIENIQGDDLKLSKLYQMQER